MADKKLPHGWGKSPASPKVALFQQQQFFGLRTHRIFLWRNRAGKRRAQRELRGVQKEG